MQSLELTTKLVPINQRYSITRGRNILSKKYRECKEELQWEIRSQWPHKPLTEDVELNVIHEWGDKRTRDIDNYVKVLLDAMTGIVYEDDGQIIGLHVYKKTVDSKHKTIVQVV